MFSNCQKYFSIFLLWRLQDCFKKQDLSCFHFIYFPVQFPIMQKDDAIARYYGLEKGQVVKITYKGGMTDSLVTYRCVS